MFFSYISDLGSIPVSGIKSENNLVEKRLKQLEEENLHLQKCLIGKVLFYQACKSYTSFNDFIITLLITEMKNVNNVGQYPLDATAHEDIKIDSGNGMRKLQDEINMLTKRNCGKWRNIFFNFFFVIC